MTTRSMPALPRSTPARRPAARVWLADDAQAGPRGARRHRALAAAHDAGGRITAAASAASARSRIWTNCSPPAATPMSWCSRPARCRLPAGLAQLAACFARDAVDRHRDALVRMPGKPRRGRAAARSPRCPTNRSALARACAAHAAAASRTAPPRSPHAVALRGSARARAGGLDAASYGSWYARAGRPVAAPVGPGLAQRAVRDRIRRMRRTRARPADGDLDALAARWPGWHARLAGFLMDDPLHAARRSWPRRTPRSRRPNAAAGTLRMTARHTRTPTSAWSWSPIAARRPSTTAWRACARPRRGGDPRRRQRLRRRHAGGRATPRRRRPRLRFIANPDNPGFAVACNQGVAPGERRRRGWRSSIRIAWSSPLAAAAARAWAPARWQCADRRGPGRRGWRARPGRAPPRSRLRRMLSGSHSPPARLASRWMHARSLQQVDAVSGALMLLPRILFDRISRFDAGYRLHAEDLGLCRRVRDAGAVVAVADDARWSCAACPRARGRCSSNGASVAACGAGSASSRRRAAARRCAPPCSRWAF